MAVCKYKIYSVYLTFIFLCGVFCELNLNEDEPCVTEGLNGTCVGVHRCLTASMTYLYANAGFDVKTKGLPELPDICSYKNNEPVVCCTDCNISKESDLTAVRLQTGSDVPDVVLASLYNHARRGHRRTPEERYHGSVIGPLGEIRYKGESIASQKCFEYFERLPYPCRGKATFHVRKVWKEDMKCHTLTYGVALAVGGRNAQRWEFPHVALIGYGDDVDSAQWLCGGSVISERFILTAAHCTSTNTLGNITFAALGLLKRTDPKKYWKIYNIKRIIIHPDYKSPSKYHDIALLETETEINFGKDLLPACLDLGTKVKSPAEASGWGRLGDKQALADTLQVVDLVEYSETECARIYKQHRHLTHGYDHEKQMCYGSHNNQIDTCEGDSGGPLQINEFKCQYHIVGVTSYGKACGILGSAGMYTRVSYYVPWIESIVWPEETEVKKKKDQQLLDNWLRANWEQKQ